MRINYITNKVITILLFRITILLWRVALVDNEPYYSSVQGHSSDILIKFHFAVFIIKCQTRLNLLFFYQRWVYLYKRMDNGCLFLNLRYKTENDIFDYIKRLKWVWLFELPWDDITVYYNWLIADNLNVSPKIENDYNNE